MSSRSSGSGRKKILLNLLRAGISFGLLGYLVFATDVGKILEVLKGTDLRFILLAMLIFAAAILLFALRWHILLGYVGYHPGYRRLVIYYFIGFFFNNFLPTSIGGDVSRIFYLTRNTGNRSIGIGTVLLERILGILATLTLASVSLLWTAAYFQYSLLPLITVSLLLGIAFILSVLLNQTLYRWVARLLDKLTFLGLGARILEVFAAIHAYREVKGAILLGYIISIGCQIMLIFMNYALVLALGIEQVTPGFLFLVVPVTFVMGMTPSINGIGVKDFGYTKLLAKIGVTAAQSLSLSFLNMIVPMLVSLAGGVMLIFVRREA